MNRKVLKTMLALVIIFLCALYILKIFIPEQFVLSVEIKVIVDIGNYIDTHAWADYLFGIITSFATYWLYLCAVCKRWYLKWYECLIVLAVIGANIGLTFVDINLYSAFSVCTFILLPLLFKSDLKSVGVCFTIHSISQALTLSIRNISMYMQSINSLTIYIVGLESFIWLLLFYLYNNYKGGNLWVGDSHHSTEREKEEKKNELQKLTEKSQNSQKKKQFTKKKSQTERKKTRLKIKLAIRDFLVEELWIYAIIIGSVALCSWLFNRWIEGAMLIVAHLIIRRVFNKQFHFSGTAYCIMLTLGIVWFAIPITLPVSTSLLSSIPLAFIICFFGYLAQDRVDLLKEKIARTRMTLANITKEQVIEICNELGYNKDKQDIAIMFFVDKLSNKQVWEILCKTQRNVEWDTVNKYKYRISKDFKKIIQEREK